MQATLREGQRFEVDGAIYVYRNGRFLLEDDAWNMPGGVHGGPAIDGNGGLDPARTQSLEDRILSRADGFVGYRPPGSGGTGDAAAMLLPSDMDERRRRMFAGSLPGGGMYWPERGMPEDGASEDPHAFLRVRPQPTPFPEDVATAYDEWMRDEQERVREGRRSNLTVSDLQGFFESYGYDLPDERADEIVRAVRAGGYFTSAREGHVEPPVETYRGDAPSTPPTDPAPEREMEQAAEAGRLTDFHRLAEAISIGEGNYESYNTGTRGVRGRRVGHSFMNPPPGTVTGRTINQILATGSLPGTDRRRLFAVGRYQIEQNTLRGAVAAMRLTGDELFTPELQDRIFAEYLVGKAGRGALRRFIVDGTGTVDEAQYAAAQEWASIAVPAGYRTAAGRISDGYMTYHDRTPANRASRSATDAVKAFLEELHRRRQ